MRLAPGEPFQFQSFGMHCGSRAAPTDIGGTENELINASPVYVLHNPCRRVIVYFFSVSFFSREIADMKMSINYFLLH